MGPLIYWLIRFHKHLVALISVTMLSILPWPSLEARNCFLAQFLTARSLAERGPTNAKVVVVLVLVVLVGSFGIFTNFVIAL